MSCSSTTVERTYLHRGHGFGIRATAEADWPTIAAWFTPEQMRWYSATDLDLFGGGPDPSVSGLPEADEVLRMWVVDAPDGGPIALQVHQPHPFRV